MPSRRKSVLIFVSFLLLSVVATITSKIWPSKVLVRVVHQRGGSPLRTAQLTAANYVQNRPIDDRGEFLADRKLSIDTSTGISDLGLKLNGEVEPSLGTRRIPSFTVTPDSLSTEKTDSARQLEFPTRANSQREKAPLKLYAAMADPPPGCREAHCMEYLTEVEKQDMEECDEEIRYRYHRIPDDSSCNFMDRSQGRLPVALASSEGSGNTWVRGLLERASGICTGYEVCDYMMRAHGFIGEKIKSGSVLVVKTHNAKPHWHQAVKKPASTEAEGFGSAIYILRNPYNSAIAEWHRRATNMILIKKKIPHNESHTNIAAAEYFTGELYQSTCRIKTYVYRDELGVYIFFAIFTYTVKS